MIRFIFNKAFQLGFWVAFASIVIFNAMTFTVPTETRVYHYTNRVGFPFAFYEWGGNPYVERFILFGVAADILIALFYSFLVAAFFSYLWQRDLQDTTAVR